MMSSEEETEFGLYTDKLLKKAKRTRQRVDAGEPRNSYSSIPNFSSRPTFLSGNQGLYGAIFTQQQHFGLFGPGFGPAKMLNELLGRQKGDGGAPDPEDAAAMLKYATAGGVGGAVNNSECGARCDAQSGGATSPQPTPNSVGLGGGAAGESLAHHMLRDILQGRKHDLLALEHAAAAATNENNNGPSATAIVSNNNNNEPKMDAGSEAGSPGTPGARQDHTPPPSGAHHDSPPSNDSSQSPRHHPQQQQQQQQDQAMADDTMAGLDTESLPSPKAEPASPAKPEDAKRARVENIVSGMRSSPAPVIMQPQVNGCKKRKLYQPQQHDSAADRYIDEEDDEPEPIRQKKVEKNALKTQLRTMQEQLAEMQQKYVQLCTRMEQESDCPDVEEVSSDADDRRSVPGSPVRGPTPAPSLGAVSASSRDRPDSAVVAGGPGAALAHQVGKMKLGGPTPGGHVPPPFNGLLHDHHHHHHHHAHMTGAAAMYLGVGHKLLMEQEARLAKEAAVAAAVAESHQQAAQHQAQQAAAAHQAAQHHHHHAAAQQQHAAAQQQQQQQQHAAQQQQQQQQQAAAAAAAAAAQLQHHQQMREREREREREQRDREREPSGPPVSQQQTPSLSGKGPSSDLADRLGLLGRGNVSTPTGSVELEALADALKSEITASLSNIIDSIVTRFVHQRRLKASEASAAAEQLNKDLLLASHMLDRKSPRTKVADRPGGAPPPPVMMNGTGGPPGANGPYSQQQQQQMMSAAAAAAAAHLQKPELQHVRPPMFQAPKPPGLGPVPMYAGMGQGPFCVQERDSAQEQNEALSLVVTPKKKRHKVTDTRITPRTVSRILAQDGMGLSPAGMDQGGCPSPRPYHQAPPMLPVSLPTSVAIPNPGLHESQVFSPYSPFFHGPGHGHHMPMQASSSPPGINKMERDSPPLPHPPTLLHPALLAAAQHGGSPDYSHIRAPSGHLAMDASGDRSSDCNSADITYDGVQPTISFSCSSLDCPPEFHHHGFLPPYASLPKDSLTPLQSSTLTPMHLRKAKLMFFWVRYPSSAVLKMYFPDIKFNKNNTAQLVKWFSNFREFYYIQMEKYARQAVSEGVKNADDLHVSADSEIYRVLNLHYNRNNHIEVPSNFRFVVEQTLREFFKAIQGGKDSEQSWKKSIYKIISRLDDPVPEYFKSPNFLEQLE